MDDKSHTGLWVTAGIFVIGFLFIFFVFIWPLINVWRAGMVGKAELSQADYNRQVQVVQAQANLQAQKFNADSEVIRAQGVAQANNIVKNTITDQYIRYLWVQTLENNKGNQIIYVPTEMGLPLTEAGRATQLGK